MWTRERGKAPAFPWPWYTLAKHGAWQPLLQPHSVAAARHVVRHGGQEAERGVDGPRCGGLAGEGWRRLRCIGHTSRAPTRCCTYMPYIGRHRTSERIREGCQGEEECRWWWECPLAKIAHMHMLCIYVMRICMCRLRRKRVAARLVGLRLGHTKQPQQLARHLVRVGVGGLGLKLGLGLGLGLGWGWGWGWG